MTKTLERALILWFTCGAIWLFVYAARLLDTSPSSSWVLEWAWSTPVERFMYLAAPAVLLGPKQALTGTTVDIVICDWMGALFYGFVVAALVFTSREGIDLAFVAFCGNAGILAYQVALLLLEPELRTPKLVMVLLMIACVVGYVIVSLQLWKIRSRLKKNDVLAPQINR